MAGSSRLPAFLQSRTSHLAIEGRITAEIARLYSMHVVQRYLLTQKLTDMFGLPVGIR